MKTKIKRNGRKVVVTVYIPRRNIYLKELEKLLNRVELDPYSKLILSNEVEDYLEKADHYIVKTEKFKKYFYSNPYKYIFYIKKKIIKQIRKHLEDMM